MFNISKPTQQQLIHSAERIVGAFVAAAYATWQLQGHQVNKAAVHAAIIAGGIAAWQIVTSIFTTL